MLHFRIKGLPRPSHKTQQCSRSVEHHFGLSATADFCSDHRAGGPGRLKRIWTLLLTFYQRARDRDHLATLELDARNDLRQDRVYEETRKRFWQS